MMRMIGVEICYCSLLAWSVPALAASLQISPGATTTVVLRQPLLRRTYAPTESQHHTSWTGLLFGDLLSSIVRWRKHSRSSATSCTNPQLPKAALGSLCRTHHRSFIRSRKATLLHEVASALYGSRSVVHIKRRGRVM
ncbi:hypothetical protein BV20DRAFT_544162 [Pilatotrama ljubarskyi]|nr:hypothetical protein BV20DRAFT_544162 [Pilatotrama ljubarskyi]